MARLDERTAIWIVAEAIWGQWNLLDPFDKSWDDSSDDFKLDYFLVTQRLLHSSRSEIESAFKAIDANREAFQVSLDRHFVDQER